MEKDKEIYEITGGGAAVEEPSAVKSARWGGQWLGFLPIEWRKGLMIPCFYVIVIWCDRLMYPLFIGQHKGPG
jgi:hypothetical protein